MPVPVENGPSEVLLTTEEIGRIARLAVSRFGVNAIRLTGGEPTVRREILDIVEAVAASGVADLSMTTHGAHLARLAPRLFRAGLRRVNVSLDSVSADRYARITGRDRLDDVIRGLRVAREVGLDPIKLNAVLVAGEGIDAEIVSLVEFAAVEGCSLRFIEYMPLDSGRHWSAGQVVTGEEVIEVLRAAGWDFATPAYPPGESRGSDPAAMTTATRGDLRVEVGVIASVSEPFCSACDRLRITADGAVRACLFSHDEVDLRQALRDGTSDDGIAALIAAAVWRKPEAHGIGTPTFIQPRRAMSRIGG